jgi:hypothetical protein
MRRPSMCMATEQIETEHGQVAARLDPRAVPSK